MDSIKLLRSIAESLGLDNIVSELEAIDTRSKQENANIILPLVGEFSSGKTTLINALTDSKKLETATKPTTATIYEVHFGCDSCHAKVLDQKGELHSVQDVAELKNDILADAKVVTVFDTSNRVPATTILVDTPGLSSPDQKHKQTLVGFLPKADGIMLVSDINQQITRSLVDFIETMKLSRRPIYLILSKSDTKSKTEIEAVKKYISDNCQIPLKQIAVVSASTGELDELYSLLDSIQKDKKDILKKVDSQRVKNIIDVLTNHIDELMNASNSDKDLEEAIRRCQYELDKISRNIDRLVDSMSDDIEEEGRILARKFDDTIFDRLNGLVNGKSNDFDAEAISVINNTATLLLNEYRNSIKTILREKANQQKGSDNEVSLSSLVEIDMTTIPMTGLSYNLDLNSMGHEYDGWIKTGVIAVAAAATVAAVAASGGTAAGLTAAATVDNVVDVADTVSDVASIASNQKTRRRIEQAVHLVSNASDKYNSFNESNQRIGQQMGSEKGMIDSMVGFVTDKIMSKPQRVRAIRNYIDSSLTPEFKLQLSSASQSLVISIRNSLQNEASTLIGQKTHSLNQLKSEMKEKKDVFENRMKQLREYKTLLLTI